MSAADKVKAIAVEYVRKKYTVKGELELETLQFDCVFYRVYGHYKDDKGVLRQFSIKVDRDGNVVE